jgi:hypothetical protein
MSASETRPRWRDCFSKALCGQIQKQPDASLKRLKVDYVDLYQCHRYDVDTPLGRDYGRRVPKSGLADTRNENATASGAPVDTSLSMAAERQLPTQ